MLSALLGEMHGIKGKMKIRGSVAYVRQQAWIQNVSIRSNILFGKEFKENLYKKVVKSCDLEADINPFSG
jgi:ABC-type multidrug transport system fused ATPase/permease subunit